MLDVTKGYGLEMANLVKEDLVRVHKKAFVSVEVKIFFIIK